MIFFILAVPLFIWLVYSVFKEEFSPLRKIPYASGSVPIFGHALVFLREKNHLKLLQDWKEKHGPIYRYNRGFGESRVFLSDPDLIKYVTVTNAKNYARSSQLRKYLPSIGNGLFSSNGRDHALQRKMINPAFHYNNLKGLVDDFHEVACNLVTLWTEKTKNAAEGFVDVSIHTDLTHLTFDIIGRCAFGYNFNTVLSGETEISKAFTEVIKGLRFARVLKKTLIPLYKYLPLEENIRERNAHKLTDDIVLEVIRERRKRKEKGIVSPKRDLLDLLMELRDEETGVSMDDELLRAQVFTFMLAGHETTSVSMTWTLYELARHPDIAEQIREEARAVMKDCTELTWSKLAEMKFLGNVIKESLRRHAPAAMTLRVAKEKDVIGGYEIPKGTTIAVGLDAVQLSPKFWKDPDAFNPHRFDEYDENSPAVHPYTFVPFSAGPRSCIGNKFAITEMKAVVATLVQHFHFEEIPGFTVTPLIRLTVRPDPPLRLRIRKLATE